MNKKNKSVPDKKFREPKEPHRKLKPDEREEGFGHVGTFKGQHHRGRGETDS